MSGVYTPKVLPLGTWALIMISLAMTGWFSGAPGAFWWVAAFAVGAASFAGWHLVHRAFRSWRRYGKP